MSKPICVSLEHGKILIHTCSGVAYQKIVGVCGLSSANIGDFVYLSGSQVDELRKLSADVPVFGSSFIDTISAVGPNNVSGGIVATLTCDDLETRWVMLHVHRHGNAETSTDYGINKNDEVIKEDILALSANVDITQDSSLLQRFHGDYVGRYTQDMVYKITTANLDRGKCYSYNDFMSSTNQLCCDVVAQPYNGVQEMLSSMSKI